MSPAAGDFERIPVIDVGPLRDGDKDALGRIARDMREASETAGFFYVTGHGVADEVCRRAQRAAAAFFARPEDEKRACAVDALHRGFVGFGQTKLSDGARADLKESFVWGLELGPDDADVRAGKALMGPNQWPADMPEFRAALMGFYDALSACARTLLRPLAVGIDLPEDWFVTRFEKPLARGAVLRYPPQPPTAPADQFGTSAHTDYGGITLVWQDENGGLEVENPRGDWVAATPIPGAFVVNVGDLLERWTNHRFASNPHRVTNRSGRERYSMALFFDPDFDTVIECIETCTGSGDPPRHPPVRCGDYIVGRFNDVFEYRK